jgi:hypothetical protein
MRRDAMAAAVPRQEQQGGVAEPAADHRVGRRAERGADRDLFDVAEPVELVETAATDDAQGLTHTPAS